MFLLQEHYNLNITQLSAGTVQYGGVQVGGTQLEHPSCYNIDVFRSRARTSWRGRSCTR